MWRIAGLLFFNDKDHFVDKSRKAFCKECIISFLNKKGIALFDTATAVRRLQDNASDKFLEVVQPTDIAALLQQLPQCEAIVTTGQKATDTLCALFSLKEPKVGDFTEFIFEDRPIRLYRMPSSSRAYPLALEKKSGSLSRYVSGLTNAISDFPFKIKGQRACRFESFHYLCSRKHGSSSVGRAPVSKTGCREFEPLLPCNRLIRQSHRSRNINQLMRL